MAGTLQTRARTDSTRSYFQSAGAHPFNLPLGRCSICRSLWLTLRAFSVLRYRGLAMCPVAAPPPEHRRDRSTSRGADRGRRRACSSWRVLAIPAKRADRRPVSYLTRVEVDALLAAPDLATRTARGTALCCCWPCRPVCGYRSSPPFGDAMSLSAPEPPCAAGARAASSGALRSIHRCSRR